MGGLLDVVKWNESKLTGCFGDYETPIFNHTHDLDLGFSRSNCEKVIFEEWEYWLTWNKNDMSPYDWDPSYDIWLRPNPLPWPWSSGFSIWNLKFTYETSEWFIIWFCFNVFLLVFIHETHFQYYFNARWFFYPSYVIQSGSWQSLGDIRNVGVYAVAF